MATKLGITGGIGSGKSVVSDLLRIMGIKIYDSDFEAKKLVESDELIRMNLSNLLGDEVYLAGKLNKPLLSSFLFANPENTDKVNSIIHPRVKEHFLEWAEKYQNDRFIGLESAILVESGFADCVDKIVLVTAPLELRIERAVKRDNSSRDLIMRRVLSQTQDEYKELYADFVIVNDDKTPLIPQVVHLIGLLEDGTLS